MYPTTTEIPQLLEILNREYGLQGTLTELPGENQNYLLTTDRRERFVLKISLPGYSQELARLESAAIEAVYNDCPTLTLPHLVETRSDALAAEFHFLGSSEARFARLYEFVDGETWPETPPPSNFVYAQLGRIVARVACALGRLDLPAARRTHRWDLANAGMHRAKVALIEDARKRRLAHQAFALWAASAQPYLESLPHQVIHGDLNDENIRMFGGRIHGLLDFGDCLYNPAVCDLALALTYSLFDQEDPFSAGAQLVRSYHELRPLGTTELEVLFPLICGRLAVSVVVAAERRRIDPERTSWFATEARAWRALERYMSFDPLDAAEALAAGTGVPVFADRGADRASLLARRKAHFGRALSLTYTEPVKFIRGRGQFLIDERGRPYLDLYNNVPHVGHSHPRVVAAAREQMARLNTNTRYLYDSLYEYADRLCATLPDPLQVCFFVNSGTEANELALRLAYAHTGRKDVLVLDHAYHGHTQQLIAVSPYKFLGKGGSGSAETWVHVLQSPDGYRGQFKGQGRETGLEYAREAARVLTASEEPIAALLAETLPSCAGQIIPPDGYFESLFVHVRAAGGLCILDEVQVGFGRVGSHFWTFEHYGVIPDILVLGKPMGNGHPIGAVVTSREIAESFAGPVTEFFSTFGGNAVSCAVGLAVLDVIRDEGLQENARLVGASLIDGLSSLKERHPIIGDVRGLGLFIGIELVRDRQTLEPAPEEAAALLNGLRGRWILTGIDGPLRNVIKIKPPLVVTAEDAARAIDEMDDILKSYPTDNLEYRV